MTKVKIIHMIIHSDRDINHIEWTVENLLNNKPFANVTWLSAAGNSYTALTAVVTWLDK